MKILFIVYDNEHHIPIFPQNLGYISTIALKKNYEVFFYHQDIHHYSEEHLEQYLRDNHFDIIGIGVIAGYYQYRKLLKISKVINNCKNRDKFLYILGGHGPTPEPEFFLRKMGADVVVKGEGEITFSEFLDWHTKDSKFDNLKNINGISYIYNNEFYDNKPRSLIQDIDTIDMPSFDLFPMEIYRLIQLPATGQTDFACSVLSGRGCKFQCNFCYRMDKGLRVRKSENIINEIEYLKSKWNINYIIFSDELLMASRERTISLCEDLIKAKLNIKWWCNGRLNFAFPDVLKVMKEAGCVFINYGIESFNDDILKVMHKGLTTKIIETGIKNTLDSGINPGLNVMFGNLGETVEHLKNTVDFLLKYDNQAQLRTVRPLTPYPGTELYYYALKNNMIKDIEDFYENRCINSDLVSINFTHLTDEEFHMALYDANERIINNFYDKKKEYSKEDMNNLYIKRDTNFHGFRRY
jgi:anaerobic magnesium-protoporphyrin IX monomethyl ester cyclase